MAGLLSDSEDKCLPGETNQDVSCAMYGGPVRTFVLFEILASVQLLVFSALCVRWQAEARLPRRRLNISSGAFPAVGEDGRRCSGGARPSIGDARK